MQKRKCYTKSELIEELARIVDLYYSSSENICPALDPKIARREDLPINKSLKYASAEDISRLSLLLPWSAASQCSRFLIGGQYSNQKRNKLSPIPDSLVLELDKMINLGEKIVIESGCFEGIHSVSMALCGATAHGLMFELRMYLSPWFGLWFMDSMHQPFLIY